MFTVYFYKEENGRSPVDEFLDKLKKQNRKLYVKTEKMLQLLEETGNALSEPYSKSIEGIFELRVIQGTDIVRMFYFFSKEKIIIVDHGIIKRSRKTPGRDIETAIRRKRIYEKRMERNE